MALIRTNLLVIVAVCVLCNYYTFGAINIFDDREMDAFGVAVSLVLQKTVNPFLIIRIFTFGDPQKLREEIDAVMRNAKGKLVFEVQEYEKVIKQINNQYGKAADEEKEDKTKLKNLDFDWNFCKEYCLLAFDSLQTYTDKVNYATANDEGNGDDVFLEIMQSSLVVKFIRNASSEEIFELAVEHLKRLEEYTTPTRIDGPNIYTVVNNKHSIDLIKINQLSNDCKELEKKTINLFSKDQMKWETELKPLKKLMNFNGCTFNFDLTGLEGVNFDSSDKYQNQYSGHLIKMLNETASFGNFKWSFDKQIDPQFQEQQRSRVFYLRLSEKLMESFKFVVSLSDTN